MFVSNSSKCSSAAVPSLCCCAVVLSLTLIASLDARSVFNINHHVCILTFPFCPWLRGAQRPRARPSPAASEAEAGKCIRSPRGGGTALRGQRCSLGWWWGSVAVWGIGAALGAVLVLPLLPSMSFLPVEHPRAASPLIREQNFPGKWS